MGRKGETTVMNFKAMRSLAMTFTVLSCVAGFAEAAPVDEQAARLFIAGEPIPASFAPAEPAAAVPVASAREAQLTDNGESAEDYRERVADAAEALRLSPSETAQALRVYLDRFHPGFMPAVAAPVAPRGPIEIASADARVASALTRLSAQFAAGEAPSADDLNVAAGGQSCAAGEEVSACLTRAARVAFQAGAGQAAIYAVAGAAKDRWVAEGVVVEEAAAPPTDEPTAAPTDEPTAAPTDEPNAAPTDEPIVAAASMDPLAGRTPVPATARISATAGSGYLYELSQSGRDACEAGDRALARGFSGALDYYGNGAVCLLTYPARSFYGAGYNGAETVSALGRGDGDAAGRHALAAGTDALEYGMIFGGVAAAGRGLLANAATQSERFIARHSQALTAWGRGGPAAERSIQTAATAERILAARAAREAAAAEAAVAGEPARMTFAQWSASMQARFGTVR